MFVTLKKYRIAVAELATKTAEMRAAISIIHELQCRLAHAEAAVARSKQNTVAMRTVPQFNNDQLHELLQLVHPDKHGGKASAIRLTQHINALREK